MSHLRTCYHLDCWRCLLSVTPIFPRKGVGCDYIFPRDLVGQMGQPLTLFVVLSWILFSVRLFRRQERETTNLGLLSECLEFEIPFFASFYFGLVSPTDAEH